MKKLVIAVVLCMAGQYVSAAVYEWTDDKGVINFTDNAEKIPARYRSKARVKDMSEEKNISVIKEGGNQPGPSGAARGEAYGGRDKGLLLERIASMKEQISKAEEQLQEKRRELEELHRRRVLYQKPSDRVEYNGLKAEIEGDEATLRDLRNRLAAAEAEAAAAGNP